MQDKLEGQELNLPPLIPVAADTEQAGKSCVPCQSCFLLAENTGRQPFVPGPVQAALATTRTPAACATCRPASPETPSSPASGSAPPPRCCSGPGRSSPPSPCASCCACCRWRWAGWRLRAGKGRPGRWKSPCRQGWAVPCGQRSCSGTSPDPRSSSGRAFRRCLRQKTEEITCLVQVTD